MSTTETELQQAVAVPKKKKLRPARKQVKPGEVEHKEPVQTGKEYNIWYNKWAGGDREDPYSTKVKSQTRCNIKRDSGITRANTTGNKFLCLFFARGCCPYGWECEYLHVLPDTSVVLPDSAKDCFGRDKFADYRDDMGGVGSYNRQNRTLYIGRVKETGTGSETEQVVIRHFREWGEIEQNPDHPTGLAIRVLQYRSVAFVTYKSELSAQFAKEAMACQSLDNDEILNVRWATEDPNEASKTKEKRRIEELGQELIKTKVDPRVIQAMRHIRALEDGEELDEDGYLEDQDGGSEETDEPGAKRRRIENGPSSPPPTLPQPVEPPQPQGLLSTDTLESLKYFAEIRKNTGAVPASRPPVATAAGLGLADYGSDDDEYCAVEK